MVSFTHVEDYIEVLAGYDPGNAFVFNSGKFSFSLARYDVNIVQSMATASMWNTQAYTDKQGELAIKLVLKYKRQFAGQGIDIAPVEENPQWRHPLRIIDRSRRIWFEGGDLLAKFPYNSDWIEDFRKLNDAAQGRGQWDHERCQRKRRMGRMAPQARLCRAGQPTVRTAGNLAHEPGSAGPSGAAPEPDARGCRALWICLG